MLAFAVRVGVAVGSHWLCTALSYAVAVGVAMMLHWICSNGGGCVLSAEHVGVALVCCIDSGSIIDIK